MYTAKLYIAFQRKYGKLEHRLITSSDIPAADLNIAKAHTSRLCKNNDTMSDWSSQDPKYRWSPIIKEGNRKFYRKTFRTPPANAAENLDHAFVDLVIG